MKAAFPDDIKNIVTPMEERGFWKEALSMMKISINPPLFSQPARQTPSALSINALKERSIQNPLSQVANQAVRVTLSKDGLAHSHGLLSGEKYLEEVERLKKEGIPMEEIPSYCQSINFGIGLGGSLQDLGQKYAEKYDEIVQNHGRGNRVLIEDTETGELRDATLEEKLAVLDKSFEEALDFAKYAEEQRPTLINCLERRIQSLKAMGATDLADENEYRLEKMKRIPKLPEDFRKNMIQIRDNFKIAYHESSKGAAWESMLKAIQQLFSDDWDEIR